MSRPSLTERQLLQLSAQYQIPRARAIELMSGAKVDVQPEPNVDPSFPIRLRLPWSALVSDNDKYVGQVRHRKGEQKPHAQLTLTPKYREAKAKVVEIASQVMAGMKKCKQPLRLVCRVWVCDNRPGHDVANFAKGLLDAMQGVVYTNDELLHDVRFIRMGVDVDSPRADVEITPV